MLVLPFKNSHMNWKLILYQQVRWMCCNYKPSSMSAKIPSTLPVSLLLSLLSWILSLPRPMDHCHLYSWSRGQYDQDTPTSGKNINRLYSIALVLPVHIQSLTPHWKHQHWNIVTQLKTIIILLVYSVYYHCLYSNTWGNAP